MNKPRILFSIPTRHHVEIALDEMEGMQELGYTCDQFPYAAKEGVTSTTGRLKVIVQNALQLVKVAKRFNPDVIYFNSRLEVLAGLRDYITIFLVKSLYRKKVRFVIKSHGSDLDVLNSTSFAMSKVVLPFLKKNISGWLLLSSEEKRIATESNQLPAEKVYVTKNIVRGHHFKPNPEFKKRLNIAPESKALLFVGRLIKEKGILDVINAFAKIKDRYNATLIIVGWGPEEESLKQLCSQLDIASRVIFTGFIPEQQVVDYYTNCDMLVFPTYFPEGFPMSLFNSIAAGLPVITTPTRAATDYLSEPENCLWVQAKDSTSVAAALQRMLDSDQLMAEMKNNNLSKGKMFSKRQVCTELADTINQITKL